jgi:ABC-type antimicrobial peptide transport system permease subunit
MLVPKNANHIFIRVQAGKTAEALELIEDAFLKYNANFPFEYHFLDDQFEQQYKSENMVGQLSSWFACIATAVSCLGLFGLALFSVEVRRREIGIRKVLGARSFHIVLLLSKDFLKLVFIANLIAAPLGWWIMNNWLSGFAYRTSISWWVFILTCAIALLISLFTVGFQTFKAAMARPVKSLRIE